MRDFEPARHHPPAPERAPATPAPARARQSVPASAPPAALDAASVTELQRTAGNQAVVQLLGEDQGQRSPVHDVVGGGGGDSLDPGTRSTMESAFGRSFGDVRVHTGEAATRSAESVGAHAYTVGSDVVFRSGHYDPGTPTGQRTLAHELSHVVQQSQGPVDGSDAPGGIRLSDPSDRFEQAADQNADRVMSSVQRQDMDDEDEPPL